MKPIDLAIIASKSGCHHQHKMGAAIFHKRKLISIGINHSKTHPIQKRYSVDNERSDKSIYLHAEIAAIIAAKGYTNNSHIYVARWLRSNNIGDSRPCKACHNALLDAGISKVTYFENGLWKTEKLKDTNWAFPPRVYRNKST